MRRQRSIGPLVLTAPATVGLLLFFVAPLVAFGVYSFLTGTLYDVESPLTLDNYKDVVETDVTGGSPATRLWWAAWPRSSPC